MNEKRTSIFENGLIWFGAGVSLAEILTGTYFAPLGFGKGVLAIIIGHQLRCNRQGQHILRYCLRCNDRLPSYYEKRYNRP